MMYYRNPQLAAIALACICLILFLGCGGERVAPNSHQSQGSHEPQWILPEVVPHEVQATWVDIFFSSIKEKNDNVAIQHLKDREVRDDAYEIRVYAGFGLQPFMEGGHPLDLLVITYSDGDVTSKHYPPWPHGPIKQSHPDPAFWNELSRKRIFDLPDSSTVEDYPLVRDGIGYVVEIKQGGVYKHYMYSNPSSSDAEEAKYMLKIIATLEANTTFGTWPDKPE